MQTLIKIIDNEPKVSHRVIAENTENESSSISRLITEYKMDFEEFGEVRFEIGSESLGAENKFLEKQQKKTYFLNEAQATLLMTYLKNNEIVRKFKKRLVKEFCDLQKSQINRLNNSSYASKDSIDKLYISSKFDAYETKIELANVKHQVTQEKLNNALEKVQFMHKNYSIKYSYLKEELEIKNELIAEFEDKKITLFRELDKRDKELQECYIQIHRLKQSLEDQIIDFQSMPQVDEGKEVRSIAKKNISKIAIIKILKLKYFTKIPNRHIATKANVATTDIPVILRYFNMEKQGKVILDKSDFTVNGLFANKLNSFIKLMKMPNDEKRELAIECIKKGDKPLTIKKELLISQHYYEQCVKDYKSMKEIGE